MGRRSYWEQDGKRLMGGGVVQEVVGVLKYTIRKVKNYCIHINIMYVYHFFLGGGL